MYLFLNVLPFTCSQVSCKADILSASVVNVVLYGCARVFHKSITFLLFVIKSFLLKVFLSMKIYQCLELPHILNIHLLDK